MQTLKLCEHRSVVTDSRGRPFLFYLSWGPNKRVSLLLALAGQQVLPGTSFHWVELSRLVTIVQCDSTADPWTSGCVCVRRLGSPSVGTPDFVLREDILPDLQGAPCPLSPFTAEGGETKPVDSSSSYKGSNAPLGAPHSWLFLTLTTFQRPHLLTPSQWGWGLEHRNLRGHKHSAHKRSVSCGH